jgi:hypothetical protein
MLPSLIKAYRPVFPAPESRSILGCPVLSFHPSIHCYPATYPSSLNLSPKTSLHPTSSVSPCSACSYQH